MHSHDKWQQATMPSPIAMDAFKVTINCNGCNRCHHRGASKHLQNKPLKSNEEGRGNQPRSCKRPRRWTQQGHCEGVVSITTILMPQRQLLSHSSVNCCKHKTNNKTCGVLPKIPLGHFASQDLSKKQQKARRTRKKQWQKCKQQRLELHQKLRHRRPLPWELLPQ